MKDDDFIISGFDSKANEEASFAVDFSAAQPLDRGGSTCDVYEATVQRRRVFVKRLKGEYHDNPLYRAAFNKEYDLGVTLSHPSLPRYVGFGGDYIVLDFIEGDTLADLIKRDDTRLKNKRFVKKLLLELVEVVEYLHNRNIVHCDIKADNIIISPYPDRPATLVDFDKAHSPWLADTSGDPHKYDCEGCADGKIDLAGIGKIAGQLGQKRIAVICKSKDATIDNIRKKLKKSFSRLRVLKWSIGICVIAVSMIGLWEINKDNKFVGRHPAPPAAQSANTALTDTDNAEIPTMSAPANPTYTDAEISDKQVAAPSANLNNQTQESTASTTSSIDSTKDDFREVDEIVKRYYGSLYPRHKLLRKLAADPKTDAQQLLIVYQSYCDDQMKAQGQIMRDIIKLYGLQDHPFESHILLGKSKEWARFMKQDSEINKLYSREIEKRGDSRDSLSR